MNISGKNLSKNAVWTLGLKIFGATSGLLVMIILTRVLTVSDMGYFVIAQSLGIFIAMLARLGMKQPVVKLISRALAKENFGQINEIIKSTQLIVGAGVLIVIIIIWGGTGKWMFESVFSAPQIFESLIFWLLLVLILAFQSPLAETFRGLHNVRFAMLFDGPFGNFIFLVFLTALYLIHSDISFEKALVLLCLSVGVNYIIGFFKLRNLVEKYPSSKRIYPLGEMLELGFPVLLVNVSAYLVAQSGLWVCGAYLEPDQAAIFGTALRFMLVISLPVFVLNMVIQPVIVHLHTLGDKDELQKQIRRATTFATIPSFIMCIGVITYAARIMEVMFGIGYVSGATALIFLTIAQLIVVWVGPCVNFMLLAGGQKIVARVVIMTGMLTVFGSLYLVNYYGITGVAAATSIGLIMQMILVWMLAKKTGGVFTHAYCHPVVIYKLLIGLKHHG